MAKGKAVAQQKTPLERWRGKIDRTLTYKYLGRNGIHYEYLMPLRSKPENFYKKALAVVSRKSKTTKYDNGRRPGEYQPIGDVRYFNFYRVRKMKKLGQWEDFLDAVVRRKQAQWVTKIKKAIFRKFGVRK